MTDEPNYVDLTNYVKAFDLLIKTDLPQKDGEVYSYEWTFPKTEINMTIDGDFILDDFQKSISNEAIMKMTNRGRWWFDVSFDADVIMTGIKLQEDGTATATYKSMRIVDHTPRWWFPNLLRWIFRRPNE